MNSILRIVSVCLLIHVAIAPPPRRNEHAEKKHEGSQEKDELEDYGLEYNRYLKEVIDLLESDPEFKRKLEDAQEVDIRSGQIAKELEFVDHKVRTRLDEVKRQEIERLRHLAQRQYEITNGIETEHVKVSSEHLDHENPHTFEMEDLKKLIAKVSADLSEADKERRKEFKEYEMQKEFEKQQKLKHLQGSEREAFEKQLKENETKHKQHEPLHHPGSKQQLEEVWEKQDHMEQQEFDPKIFFRLHDLDGNGFWDQSEVKTLFLKELDKMYEAGAPEDDMKERVEEMERMREHVFSEADKNNDGLISYEEFVDKTKQPDFEKDSGWESIDQKPVFTQEEYQEFERRRLEEVQRMIQQGLIPPQPVFQPGPGYHPQVQYQQYQGHQGGHPYPPQGQQPPYRYAQEFPNAPPHHGYPNQQPGGHSNQLHQPYPNVQQHQGIHNQAQSYQNSQGQQQQVYHQPNQGYQQTQEHHNQPSQGSQQHQQIQRHQEPPAQNHQNQPQGYQQPTGHQNQPSPGHQQQQQEQAPLTNVNNPPPQANAPSQNHQNQPSQIHPVGHDPNEIHAINPQHPDSKYSKDGGNNHPNVIDLHEKKVETNEHQQKLPNQ